MTRREAPRDSAGAKVCGWCGGEIRQSGVGRSRDYCSRTHKEYAYRQRRDERLVAAALADAAAVSTTGETGLRVSPVVETPPAQVAPPIPAPAADGDYVLAPPAPGFAVEPDPPAERVVLSGAVLPPPPSRAAIEEELARRVAWIESLDVADGE